MAAKRMFSLQVVDTDAFLDMPLSSQALYFHLSMRADDDGFVSNANKIMRMIGACKNDYDILMAKRFIIPFENGICVIKHWKLNNYIQKDRYKPTTYTELKDLIKVKSNGVYTLKGGMDTVCIQDVSNVDTQIRLDKYSIDNIVEQGTTSSTKKQKNEEIIKQVIDYLNTKTGKHFSYKTKATVKHINGRISEGRTVEDFKFVIDNRFAAWQGTQMEEYLRPSTLFNPTNFENYLNSEMPKSKNDKKSRIYKELD